MKSFVASALVLLVASGAAHAEGASGSQDPIDVLGLNRGMEYKEAKATLLASGWLLQPPSGESEPVFPATPEIECGSGFDAICSVGFSKGAEAFGVIVEQRGNSTVVIGAY